MPTARSNGFKVAYEVAGNGPPLVLHPGMFQLGEHWTRAGHTSRLTSAQTVITAVTGSPSSAFRAVARFGGGPGRR